MPWDFWLIFFVLGVLVPWRGYSRLQQLLARPRIESRERLSLYLSTIAFQWIAAGVTAWRAWARGLTPAELGFSTRPEFRIAALAAAGAVFLAAFQWFNLRRVGRLGAESRGNLQPLAERILPRTPPERVTFFALAITAGFCEEFLYRGFAVAAFSRAGLAPWIVVLISAALFGLAHLYQGKRGLVSTGILGLLFGAARVTWMSLAPVVVWHSAVDLAAGIAGPRYLIHNDKAPTGAAAPASDVR